MSLTQTDLKAIQSIIQTTVPQLVQPIIDDAVTNLQATVEEAIDSLAQSTAAGFAEVHAKLAEHDQRFEQIDRRFEQVDRRFEQIDEHFERIEVRLDHIETKLDPTIERVDDHGVRLRRLDTKAA